MKRRKFVFHPFVELVVFKLNDRKIYTIFETYAN